jgi:aldehyde dehydrogenase (NAD+)
MTVTAPTHFPPCLIGGEEEHGVDRFDVTYPYTGEVIGTAPVLSAEAVGRALDLAAAARIGLDRYERRRVCERVAEAIAAAAAELAALISWESGLCVADTLHEVARAEDVFRAAAREAVRDRGEVWACDVSPNGRARRAFTTREPVRVVAAITPFNHPLNQVIHKVAPSVATNNRMVLKPSE